MKITYKQLTSAAEQKLLTHQQAEQLWLFFQEQNKHLPSFQFTHILYYLGGLIAIGAMSLFMTLGWEHLGGIGLLCISAIYAITALCTAQFLLKRYHLIIPANILITLVIVLTPLGVYGLENAIGVWDNHYNYKDYHRYIDFRWLFMELATVLVAVCLILRYRSSFLFMPLAFTLWYMSMDLTPYLVHLLGYAKNDINYSDYFNVRQQVSLWFGLLVVVVAFLIDIKNKSDKDLSFWLYLFGVLTFWGALSSMESDSELNKFLYFCVNLLMILIGVIIVRRVFVIFGGLGITGYLSYLSYDVFEDSLLFPFALTIIGLSIIVVGIFWQRHEKAINIYLLQSVPPGLRKYLEFKHH
ncbi:DUF2157 domain-containing protein [Gilliamella apicola]|uniref:DUF2157 domain-containing protein n=1 Tax=Gilliamella apicola TaxID=1196095 RepID=UPI000A33742F|nr:DUF2157 domain-containing protein [Gilliamella apicola]OTQ06725.1 DUF2157 domain-containing protein [Gilliamella apicola]OTQ21945.1 DUF2157 domain-containing protein [Gilliamella apicola]